MNTDRPAASWPVTTRRIGLRMDVSDEPRSTHILVKWKTMRRAYESNQQAEAAPDPRRHANHSGVHAAVGHEGALEIGAVEHGAGEDRARQARLREVGAREIGAAQVGAEQIRLRKIGPLEI